MIMNNSNDNTDSFDNKRAAKLFADDINYILKLQHPIQ